MPGSTARATLLLRATLLNLVGASGMQATPEWSHDATSIPGGLWLTNGLRRKETKNAHADTSRGRKNMRKRWIAVQAAIGIVVALMPAIGPRTGRCALALAAPARGTPARCG
jgi:hypothetical protein